MTEASNKIAQLLEELDEQFAGFYDWLAGQYDDASGGFYYARSSFDMDGFKPDIESTAQALNIVQWSGLSSGMPDEVRRKLIRFFQNKQDPASGYFYDENANMRLDEVMVHRGLGYSTGSLSKLGGEPLYALPHQATALPAFLDSPESYVAWLKAVDLRNSWRGCDFMSTPIHHVARLDESRRQAYVSAAADYFASIQDPETGFWGQGSLYIRISGTFKLHAFYHAFGIQMPNVERIYGSILTCLRTEDALDMCWVRNPMDLLGAFHGRHAVTAAELEEIIAITIANMKRLLRADGGFSRELKHSPPAPNVAQVKEGDYYPYMPAPVPIGKGLVEGDMNAATQALWIRELTHKLAGIPHKPLAVYTAGFWDKLGVR